MTMAPERIHTLPVAFALVDASEVAPLDSWALGSTRRMFEP
jgi:hypothetical protein